MKSDVPSQAPPPPTSAPVAPTQIFAPIRDWSVDDITQALEERVRRDKGYLALTPAEDGTTGIPSLIAAWLMTEVGKDIGVAKPVNLAKVQDRKDLLSVGGVARLLHREFHPAHVAAAS